MRLAPILPSKPASLALTPPKPSKRHLRAPSSAPKLNQGQDRTPKQSNTKLGKAPITIALSPIFPISISPNPYNPSLKPLFTQSYAGKTSHSVHLPGSSGHRVIGSSDGQVVIPLPPTLCKQEPCHTPLRIQVWHGLCQVEPSRRLTTGLRSPGRPAGLAWTPASWAHPSWRPGGRLGTTEHSPLLTRLAPPCETEHWRSAPSITPTPT